MLNAIMQVSPSLMGTRISSASVLHKHAKHDSFAVSSSSHVAKQQPRDLPCQKQALETVVTCLLERMLDTFSANPVPDDFTSKWEELLSSTEQAGALERDAWESMEVALGSMSGSHDVRYKDYIDSRDKLLQNLVNAKKALSKKARKFWAESKVKPQDLAAFYSRNPVFVPDQVMEEIDEIYVRHYHAEQPAEDGVNELLCFSCDRCDHEILEEDGLPVCKSTLLRYLEDVKQSIQRLPGLQDLPEEHPQRAGVTNASIRLKPLHMPIGVPGRLALPLPSRRMLEDLWDYMIPTDSEFLVEVGFFKFPLYDLTLNSVCRYPGGLMGWDVTWFPCRVERPH